ncbi:MAG: cytidine deaminase [Oscillospiraceae bacterium]|nr:cytidine deaminase [Oscillospiraceae bacterium]
MDRRDKTNYYLDIADAVSERSTCLRRRYGAVIVNRDQIISTGYVGAPRGRKNCSDLGYCIRNQLNIPRGERYELCRSVHAEMNAIINASRDQMIGATLYLCGREVTTGEYIKNSSCCSLCKRLIINSGIERVVIRDDENNYRSVLVIDWIMNDESVSGERGY